MSDLDPNHYRNNSSTQYTLAHEVLKAIDFKGTETILDIGCGDGRITAELSKCVPQGRVIGVDPSPAMIDLACQSFDYPNLDFVRGAAEELSYPAYADIVLMMNTLHWVREPLRAIQNAANALKPGGRLFLLTYPKESPYWQVLEETVRQPEWAAYEKLSAYKTVQTTEEYIDMLKQVGLKIGHYSVEECIAIYPTGEDFRNYLKGWLLCYIPLPKELEEAFLKAAVNQAYLHSLEKEAIHLPYVKLAISTTP